MVPQDHIIYELRTSEFQGCIPTVSRLVEMGTIPMWETAP